MTALPTTTPTTTPAPAGSPPQFFPSLDCLTDFYRRTTWPRGATASRTYYQVGKVSDADTCFPKGVHVATICPLSYTPAYLATRTQGDSRTFYSVRCCPEGHGFDYVETADGYDPNRLYQGSCVATQPTLPHTDESPPWTVTATELFEFSGSASATQQIRAVTVAASDVLAATAALIRYEVSSGTSCAPNCASPWHSGDPWPLPTAPSDAWPPSSAGGTNSGYTAVIAVSVVGGLVLFAFLACWIGNCAQGPGPVAAGESRGWLMDKMRRRASTTAGRTSQAGRTGQAS